MSNIGERIFVFGMATVISVWGIYHVNKYFTPQIETETVFEETISHTIKVKGIAIREEIILDTSYNGSERFIYGDGQRVGIDQKVAEYYTGDIQNRDIQNIYEYEEEVLKLQEAQNKSINHFSSVGSINRNIREQLMLMTESTSTGNVSGLDQIKKELTVQINRRSIAVGETESFENRINYLNSEISRLKQIPDSENIKVQKSPASGYFVKNIDGYENKLSPEKFSILKISDFIELTHAEQAPLEAKGKIVTNSFWYLAVVVPLSEVDGIEIGQSAKLRMGGITEQIDARVSEIKTENQNENAVIIFSSNDVSDETLNLRVSDVTVHFEQFTGLKIDSKNIRFKLDENGNSIRGVYVIDNHEIKFKQIDPIFEENDFILSRINYAGSNDTVNVRLFDQLIAGGGSDISEGQIV